MNITRHELFHFASPVIGSNSDIGLLSNHQHNKNRDKRNSKGIWKRIASASLTASTREEQVSK
jgi:hypothetical protein